MELPQPCSVREQHADGNHVLAVAGKRREVVAGREVQVCGRREKGGGRGGKCGEREGKESVDSAGGKETRLVFQEQETRTGNQKSHG